MLHVIWKAGITGKLWRILKSLSSNLSATVKTRYGASRKITRENGGLQGSSITGRLFSKQMDVLSENFIDDYDEKMIISDDLSIGCLEYVDDVGTSTIGIKNQKSVLTKVDEFAKMNKLEWGEAKCQVMQVGRKTTVPTEWALGDKQIKNTTSYKYLGDVITSDNKNKQNLLSRENILHAVTRQINTTASSEVMKGIETQVIIDLYEKCILTSFLNNAESWILSVSEERQIDKTCIQAVKRLFGLPITTPSASVIFHFGLLYATQVVDHKRFLYLHKILQRESNNWTLLMLNHLQLENIGWAKLICNKLIDYGLETNWTQIKNKTKGQWRNEVNIAVEKINAKKLEENCVTKAKGEVRVNTKTRWIFESLTTASAATPYVRKPKPEVMIKTKQKARTIIIARSGMLECGRNFKGTIKETCITCNVIDDEDHRLNSCTRWKETNNHLGNKKVDFQNVFSEDVDILNKILTDIEKVWETKFSKGRMH